MTYYLNIDFNNSNEERPTCHMSTNCENLKVNVSTNYKNLNADIKYVNETNATEPKQINQIKRLEPLKPEEIKQVMEDLQNGKIEEDKEQKQRIINYFEHERENLLWDYRNLSEEMYKYKNENDETLAKLNDIDTKLNEYDDYLEIYGVENERIKQRKADKANVKKAKQIMLARRTNK